MDKWQQRQVEQYAADNGLTRAEALAELFPDEAPAARKVSVRKQAQTKTPEGAGAGATE
ncbi:hypothetical protein ACIQMZ_37175 [Streptomyces longwoodensis]|uniref:hypothetical protein n=1 Tax=Streptomyces longwoodensis TaxID=68231 RepID=UPI0037F7B4D9